MGPVFDLQEKSKKDTSKNKDTWESGTWRWVVMQEMYKDKCIDNM